MNQLTPADRTAAQLHTAAAAARRIATERETARAPQQQRDPAVCPHPAEIIAPVNGYDAPSIRIRDIASRLSAAGLAADLAELPSVGLYLVATAHPRSGRDAEVILDEDGYAELRWWPNPDASADKVTDQLLRLLPIVTTGSAHLASGIRGPNSVQAPSRAGASDGPLAT